MGKLYFRYGIGKSAQLCQVAYNYVNERNMNVVIINAKNNEQIKSNIVIDNKYVLTRDINVNIDNNSIYEKIFEKWLNDDIKCVLVDNSEYLTSDQALELFYVSKILDIPVIAYGNRVIDKCDGVSRLMSLADDIEKIDMGVSSKNAVLDFNYGAMNCSKTAQMLTKNYSLLDDGYKTCVIKPKLDRDIQYVTSRIGLKAKADIVLDKDDGVYSHGEYLYRDRINYILVDEAQFLSEKQIEQLRRIVNDYGISVSCYGLSTDFLANLFPGSKRLFLLSDNIHKMQTVCSCGRGANFNVRIDSNGNFVREGEQVCIDNGGNYDSMCAYCFIENIMGIDTKHKEKIRKK